MFFRIDYARVIVSYFVFVLFFSIFPLLQAQAVQQSGEEVPAEKIPGKPGWLQVLDEESLQLGKMLDRELRDFSFRLRNDQKIPLKLLRVRVTCPCLSILESPSELILAPGNECQIKGRLDASKVQAETGAFTRMILVELEGQELQLVPVKGESVQMLDFEPGPGIDLGTFSGVEVPWTRTILIKSQFSGDQILELLPPPENKHFEYKLEKLSPTEYRFGFTPKLPLPKGRFKHLVDIPTRGIERYGSIQVGLFGTVTGWLLTVNERSLVIDLKKAQPGQSYTGEIKVVPNTGGERRVGRRRVLDIAKEKAIADKLETVQLVSEEEGVADSLNKLETWQKIAADLQLELPKEVALEKLPQTDGLVLKMTFPEDYFSKKPRLTVLVRYQTKVIDRLNIFGRK